MKELWVIERRELENGIWSFYNAFLSEEDAKKHLTQIFSKIAEFQIRKYIPVN